MGQKNNAISILIVEDSDEDFDILQIIMAELGVLNPILRLTEGDTVVSALEDLIRQRSPLPGIILLDLNLIGLDGREVLKRLKSHERFSAIPVIVRSTSSNPKDVAYCMSGGASAYCVKPVSLEELEDFVRALKMFWLDCAALTHAQSPAVF